MLRPGPVTGGREEGTRVKQGKRWLAVVCAVLLAAALAGCSIPMPGFADYDVSAYIQGLLDSSYKASHGEFMSLASATLEDAQENNTTTVENAAVEFCNTYNLLADDTQMDRLEDIMARALTQARYTVKEEQKVDTGYYLEVDVSSIINFSGLTRQLESLRQQAQDEATADEDSSSQPEDDRYVASEGYDEYGNYVTYDQYGDPYDPDEEESSSSAPEIDTVDVNQLYTDLVLDYCEGQLADLRYDEEPRTVALDILQTDQGELQLDMNQIKTIDQTVLRLEP